MEKEEMIKEAKDLVDEEIYHLKNFREKIDSNFYKAFKILLSCKGKIVFSGIGKSGYIARKAAASYSSTGNPSIFLNPVEAMHGDLGIISKEDVCVLISHSGNTHEVTALIPSLKNLGLKIISITSNNNSELARNSDAHINTHVKKEICPFNLAPTSSSTVTLVILDILMVILMKEKGFTKESFALFHPAGSLGKKLTLRVKDLIDREPFWVTEDASIIKLISTMSKGGKGLVPVLKSEKLIGVISDGDLRRAMERYGPAIFKKNISQIMTPNPKTIESQSLAIDCLNIMERYNITALPVLDNGKLKGVINIHDVLKSGLK